MYTRTIGAFEARRQFGKLITDVGYKDEVVVVERNGEQLAAVVPLKILKYWERERERFFNDMRRFSENSTLSEEEAMRLANEAIQAIRTEKKQKQDVAQSKT